VSSETLLAGPAALAAVCSRRSACDGWVPDGLRPSDDELRAAMNGALARWREDGTRERILSRWIPYLSRLKGEVPAR